VVDLLSRHVGLVQLHRELAMLPVAAGAPPTPPIERLQLSHMLSAKLFQAIQLALQVQIQVTGERDAMSRVRSSY
jgi:hypothetical protein